MNLPAVQAGAAAGRAPRERTRQVRDAPRQPAQTFDPWQLTRLVRHGHHLDVFRARLAANDLGPGCYVVKMPRREGDSLASAMLRREALVACNVVCPNLVSVLAPGDRYAVLPYLEGITLRQWLEHVKSQQRMPLAVVTALSIARQVGGALAAMHEVGWLHGQVHPEHVIVSPQGHATLIDLTQARRLESSECDVGGDASIAATYAAPEWSSSRGRLSAACDTYALGAVLFEMLTGHPPFAGHDAREVVAMHRTAAPPDLRSLRPEAPLECAELVRRMLAKEPLRRPSNEELVRWLAEIEIAELAV
jgi:eukaryotic-like serine/threonine-protein kinase